MVLVEFYKVIAYARKIFFDKNKNESVKEANTIQLYMGGNFKYLIGTFNCIFHDEQNRYL